MSKLTDSQLIVLSAAAARDDGLAVIPAKMNKAAATKVGASLVARKLMREMKTKPGMPIWRVDGERRISLFITAAGRREIGIDDENTAGPGSKGASGASSPAKGGASPTKGGGQTSAPALPSPRAGSKQALLIEMLSGKGGVTIDRLIEATGWLPHTTRAALTGLRKRGYAIERAREGGASVYRIAGKDASAAAA